MMAMNKVEQQFDKVHTISVVIPVFRGEETLEKLVSELVQLAVPGSGRKPSLCIEEIILVHDGGPDHSDEMMRKLGLEHPQVRNVWLSRNFGQHAATLAGMASARCEWIVTIDEDGQHDPASISTLLEVALNSQSDLVYARSLEREPHSWIRNLGSRITKQRLLPLVLGKKIPYFSSYRLMLGEVGRSLAAFATMDVYLDVALSWVVHQVGIADVVFRPEGRAKSGYSARSLSRHLLRLILTSGTRPLRIASVVGVGTFILGLILSTVITIRKVLFGFEVVGWASLFSLVLVIGGLILFVLGVIAEYIGLLVRSAIGQPLYLIVNDRNLGPLSKD